MIILITIKTENNNKYNNKNFYIYIKKLNLCLSLYYHKDLTIN